MEVAEQGRITAVTPPARLIERCDCPPGYSGLSCEVSWLLLTCISSIHLTSQMGILLELSLLQSVLLSMHTHNLFFFLFLTFYSQREIQ